MNKKPNDIKQLDALSKLELRDKTEFKKYFEQLNKPIDTSTEKDQSYYGVIKRFSKGDLVRANTNHPGWGDYKDRLLGGIVLDTDGEAPSWGTWSRPFYKVLWPYGLVEDVPDDWISKC